MQIKSDKEEPKFQPVTITITLENQEEVKALLNMTRWNVTIPELLSNKDYQKVIWSFLVDLNGTLEKINVNM